MLIHRPTVNDCDRLHCNDTIGRCDACPLDAPRCADCDVRLTAEESDGGRFCFDCTPSPEAA